MLGQGRVRDTFGPLICLAERTAAVARLASSGLDGTIRLWEAPGGRLLATVQSHTGGVWGVALSADGRLLASASFHGTVRLWEAPGGRPLAALQGHPGPVYGVALSADGQPLASGGEDGTMRLWEVSSCACLRILRSDRRYERTDITGLTVGNGWTVAAWDTPGYCRSDDPEQPFSLKDLADEAVGLLDELEVERAHVLGVSMGGGGAQLAYHRHRQRVHSLILADTNPGGGGLPEPESSARVRQRLDALERLGARGMAEARAPHLLRHGAPVELLAEVTDIMAEVRPAGYRAAAIALGQTDLTPALGGIDVLTLVIHGEQDTVVPPETGRMLADSIPGARLVLIPEAGHVSNQEQPAAFNAAVRSFLANC